MDIQAAPPTYTPAGGMRPPVGNPPVLGQQVPGFSGGLPTQGGLSVLANPLAQELQSRGRGEDTMLVHMTPGEVNSLQGLAMAHGGSLTINPETGLPEAGFLGKLLPTILGGVLAATGVGAPLAAGVVGLGSTAASGSLKKGLMAGLGAFGGASLAGAAGLGGKISQNAFGALSNKAGILGANMGTGAATLGADTVGSIVADTAKTAAASGLPTGAYQAANPGIIGRFAQTARAGLPGGIISKAAPALAATGLMQGVSGAMAPTGYKTATGQIDNSYQGPYVAQQRTATFAPTTQELLSSTKERNYFDVDVPEIRNVSGQLVQPGTTTAPGTPLLQNYLLPTPKKPKPGDPMYGQRYIPFMGDQNMGYAEGGEVELSDGAFVLDARTVSEIGNGSSNAGKEVLRGIGGKPIEGPGDGVSDSIPARIDSEQPARVARDEVVIPAEAVKRIGKGNPKRGADKLYALMKKAHAARKKADRGEDTKLRRGLA